uniref:Uncharacterized protein n=1 Tax=Leersia perrieri TaxID=77586 RepID=A0A0D9XIM2_9ORYZ
MGEEANQLRDFGNKFRCCRGQTMALTHAGIEIGVAVAFPPSPVRRRADLPLRSPPLPPFFRRRREDITVAAARRRLSASANPLVSSLEPPWCFPVPQPPQIEPPTLHAAASDPAAAHRRRRRCSGNLREQRYHLWILLDLLYIFSVEIDPIRASVRRRRALDRASHGCLCVSSSQGPRRRIR